jgi:hypothetical protein
MFSRTLLSLLALLFLLNCGGRTPPFTGDQRSLVDSGVAPVPVDTGLPLIDTGLHPDARSFIPDSGILDTGIHVPDTGHHIPDTGTHQPPPPYPDAGPDMSCALGPERVCQCATGNLGTQSCQNGRYGACVCPTQPPLPDSLTEAQLLARITQGMIGVWRGIGENQWDGEYPVAMTFRRNGNYSAYCLFPNCTALYWGFDTDDPEKTVSLYDVFANGEGDGELVIAGSGFGPVTGELTNVHLSADQQYLRFRFYNTWSGRRIGPLTFLLQKVSN